MAYRLGCTSSYTAQEPEQVELFLCLCERTDSIKHQVYQVGPLEDLDTTKQFRQGGKHEGTLCKAQQEYRKHQCPGEALGYIILITYVF